MVVAVAIAAVAVLHLAAPRWADRRDRAKGHANARTGKIGASMHAERVRLRRYRRLPRFGSLSEMRLAAAAQVVFAPTVGARVLARHG